MYIAFLIITASAFFLAVYIIIPLSQVRQRDDTPLAHYSHEGSWQKLKNQRRLFQDWHILVMFNPMFRKSGAVHFHLEL